MKNYICWSKDEENLFNSSSGGIFLELAKETLKRKGLVVGVVMPELVPYYIAARDLMGIKIMRGSKYLQAKIAPHILDLMGKFNGEILFVGLPCMIKAMKKYFKHRNNILYVELRCHGVIKQDIFNAYIRKHHSNAKTIGFRNKEDGWRGSIKLCVTTYNDFQFDYKSKLIKDYIQQKNVKGQCVHCKQQGYGDIILGDYWECPAFLENKKGTSKVVTVTAKGQRFFDSLDNVERKEHSQNKIAIMGGMTVSNNGTLIMTQNFIEYLMKEIDVGFTLLEYEKGDTGKEVMERLLPKKITDKLDYGFHSAWDLLNGKKLLGYIKSIRWRGQSNLEKQIRDCQTVVYLGGDHFVGKAILRNRALWTMRMLFTYWDFRNIKRAGKKLYLVSQTMGQFPCYLKPFAKWAFSKADRIYCRDDFSIKEMEKLGLTNVQRCYDLAFLPIYNESNYKSTLAKSDYTVLVVSDLWRKYCGSKDEFTDKLAYIASALNKITGLPVFLMAHSDNQNMDYRSGEGLLIKEIKRKTHNAYVAILSNNTAVAQRYLLGHSKLNVSLRMHASISSLQQGVPVIPIAYSSKFGAMYSDLGLIALVVGRLNMIEVAYKIEEVWRNLKYTKAFIRDRLKANNVRQRAFKPVFEIAEDLKNV